jgi:hypothetical protein
VSIEVENLGRVPRKRPRFSFTSSESSLLPCLSCIFCKPLLVCQTYVQSASPFWKFDRLLGCLLRVCCWVLNVLPAASGHPGRGIQSHRRGQRRRPQARLTPGHRQRHLLSCGRVWPVSNLWHIKNGVHRCICSDVTRTSLETTWSLRPNSETAACRSLFQIDAPTSTQRSRLRGCWQPIVRHNDQARMSFYWYSDASMTWPCCELCLTRPV